MKNIFFKFTASGLGDLYISINNIAYYQDHGNEIKIVFHKGLKGTDQSGRSGGGDTLTIKNQYVGQFKEWINNHH